MPETTPPTAADILADTAPGLAGALTSWIAQQFLADQFARLEQAGHAPEGRIPLARVFIDLPVHREGRSYDEERPEEEPAQGEPLSPGFLAELLARAPGAAAPERPLSLSPSPSLPRPPLGLSFEEERAPETQGYVLIGGPGQGKSTCGQFACQIHRAALLRPRIAQLSPRERGAIKAFDEQRRGDGLGEPSYPSFPVRIVLSDLADSLSLLRPGADRPLLRYLLAKLHKATGHEATPDDLLTFLRKTPYLLVLDGLDEVPQGAPRAQVMGAIRELLQALHTSSPHGGPGGVVVGTTRPQGYRDELGWLAPRHLAPLSQRRALHYADRLCHLRFADEPDRREHVLRTLEQASGEGEAARLLRTPLQITLMTTLVDHGGRPPRERWRLFHEYYRIFYAREMERPIPAAALLRDCRPQIDAIHRHVGLLLQAESEEAKGARALMSRARFEEVVQHHLTAEDFDEETRALRTKAIVEAALDRLVFLVAMEADQIGFEIRSLQELMAAEAITSGPEALVRERLALIAPAHAFRNVFLFAASKCFSNPDFWHLRDHFVHVCQGINDGSAGEILQVAHLGSELASDLLEEGVAREAPRYRLKLFEVALQILEIPPHDRQVRILWLAPPGSDLALQTALKSRLSHEVPQERLSAWLMLLKCIQDGAAWAKAMGDEHWPTSMEEQRDIWRVLNESAHLYAGEWLLNRTSDSAHSFSPDDFTNMLFFWRFAYSGANSGLVQNWFAATCGELASTKPFRVGFLYRSIHIVATCVSMAATPLTREVVEGLGATSLGDIPSGWRAYVADQVFRSSPSADALAGVLEQLSAHHEGAPHISFFTYNQLSWPLRGCLLTARTPSALSVLATRLRHGELGDVAEWKDAEEQWRRSDLQPLSDRRLPWPETPDARAALPPLGWVEYGGLTEETAFEEALGWQSTEASPQLRTTIADVLIEWLYRSSESPPVRLADLTRLLSDGHRALSLRSILACSDALTDSAALADLVRRAYHERRLITSGIDDLLALVRLVSPHLYGAGEPDPLVDVLYQASDPYRGMPFPRALLPALERVSPLHAAMAHIHWGFDASSAKHVAERLATALSRTSYLNQSEFNKFPFLSSHGEDTQAKILFELALNAALPAHTWWARARLRLFGRWTLAQSITLTDAALWARLGFLPPSPQPARKSEPPARPGSALVQSIHLTGFRPFDERVAFEVPRTGPDPGRWMVLLGENGVGKSTALRGVALALMDPDAAKGIMAQSTAPHVRWGHAAAEAVVRIDEHAFRARIDAGEDKESLTSFAENGAQRPFLLGYGCRRGSALGGADREVNFSLSARTATLFDERASLIHAKTWLKQLRLDAALNPGTDKEGLYDAVITTLKGILPGVSSIEVRAEGVWFEGHAVGRAPLSALSDGYVTTVGWIIDMIAHWIHHAARQKQKIPVGPDFPRTMEGLVLIDEIDLYLHPRWQVDVITAVRERFPRMSFMVTTHNPLTLLGTKPGEVFVLRRAAKAAEGAAVEVVQIDVPPGLRADQVLTGEWFGLASTLDPGTLTLLDRHRRMLADHLSAHAPERRALEAELRKRLGGFGETSLERLAQSVAAELMSEDARALSPEERGQLHDKVKARVAARDRSDRSGGKSSS